MFSFGIRTLLCIHQSYISNSTFDGFTQPYILLDLDLKRNSTKKKSLKRSTNARFQAFQPQEVPFIHDIDKIRQTADIDQERQGIVGAVGHTKAHQGNLGQLHMELRNHQGAHRRGAHIHQAGPVEDRIHSQAGQPRIPRVLERIHPGDLEGERIHRIHQADRGAGRRELRVQNDHRVPQSRRMQGSPRKTLYQGT